MSAIADFDLVENQDFEMVVGDGVRITYRTADEAFEIAQCGSSAFEVLLCIAPCHASRHSLFVFYSRFRKGAYIRRGELSTAQVFVSCRIDEAETIAARLGVRLGDAD